ncbi:hypothetical protein OTU49_010006 [Cherax quadricarinatus]|uniref:CARD domain-containing protein n=1 Tax=Cherax quadricarinatus TaxID=27406 RepID=A0AAW0WGY3_CHEQU
MYTNKMDERLKELLHVYRNKFAQIDVERIIPFLRDTGLVSAEDIDAIHRQPSQGQRIHTLLDILPAKGSQAFQTLCLALETTYPHLLTIMLIGASQRTPLYVSRQSSLVGLTSDSECEDKKSSASSTGGAEVGRPFPSASPHTQASVVSSHDYNMEQSNVALLRAELKIVTTDRDIMKKELKKVTRERDEALGRLVGSVHHPDQPANYGTLTKQGGGSLSDKSLGSSRDYESLKMQCEKAMAEVQGLLKQNMEINRKYENTMKEVDYYRKQERAAYTALQKLRMQYEEVVAEKQKLEREVTSLQTIMEDDRKEIADLRRQQQEAITQEGSGEAINQLYMTTMRKYEAIKDEYDSIRKSYSELVASHSNNISKLELTQEEVSRLKKQYDDILRECNEAVREKNCFKQQCTKAITEWDSALREKNKLQEELLKIREKYDEMMKEMNTHLIQRQHLNKDLKRLQEERNAAMQEYTLVMSERDTVHKEMDKLQEELSQASKKIKTIEQTTNDSSKERESLLLQIEMLKREIAASLHDRDKAIKECNDLRERFGAKEDTNKEWERSYMGYDNYKQERLLSMFCLLYKYKSFTSSPGQYLMCVLIQVRTFGSRDTSLPGAVN